MRLRRWLNRLFERLPIVPRWWYTDMRATADWWCDAAYREQQIADESRRDAQAWRALYESAEQDVQRMRLFTVDHPPQQLQ